jgi:hypothetical protein
LDEAANIEVLDNSPSLFSDIPDDSPDVEYTVLVTKAKLSDSTTTAVQDETDDAPLRFPSLEVHYVRGVRIDTVVSSVSRYTIEPTPKASD